MVIMFLHGYGGFLAVWVLILYKMVMQCIDAGDLVIV